MVLVEGECHNRSLSQLLIDSPAGNESKMVPYKDIFNVTTVYETKQQMNQMRFDSDSTNRLRIRLHHLMLPFQLCVNLRKKKQNKVLFWCNVMFLIKNLVIVW